MVSVQSPLPAAAGGASYPVGELFPGSPPPAAGPSAPEAPRAPAPAAEGDGAPFNREILQRALDEMNRLSENLNRRLEFGIFEGTEQFYVQVLERRSNRIIKMIPPEQFLELRARLHKAIGVVLDEAL